MSLENSIIYSHLLVGVDDDDPPPETSVLRRSSACLEIRRDSSITFLASNIASRFSPIKRSSAFDLPCSSWAVSESKSLLNATGSVRPSSELYPQEEQASIEA